MNLSQEELAEKIYVTRQTISNYILGRLTKLEDEVAPIKIENKELKKRNGYLESQHRH